MLIFVFVPISNVMSSKGVNYWWPYLFHLRSSGSQERLYISCKSAGTLQPHATKGARSQGVDGSVLNFRTQPSFDCSNRHAQNRLHSRMGENRKQPWDTLRIIWVFKMASLFAQPLSMKSARLWKLKVPWKSSDKYLHLMPRPLRPLPPSPSPFNLPVQKSWWRHQHFRSLPPEVEVWWGLRGLQVLVSSSVPGSKRPREPRPE